MTKLGAIFICGLCLASAGVGFLGGIKAGAWAEREDSADRIATVIYTEQSDGTTKVTCKIGRKQWAARLTGATATCLLEDEPR